MFRVIIADDEDGMRTLLRKALEQIEDVMILDEAENGQSAVEMVRKYKPNAVFLDVEMGSVTGLNAAKQILEIQPKCMIVFVTAFQNYMPQAFEVYAFDYLLKPFKIDRLQETVRRMMQIQVNEQSLSVEEPYREQILIKDKECIAFVHPKDIILIQREERITTIITNSGKFHTNETLTDIEKKLPPREFIRSHKSYIIQINKIHSITTYGRWTYLVKLKEIHEDALLTKEKAVILEDRCKIKIGL